VTRIARTTDIATCRALRRTVFIEEQGVSEADEVDDRDGEAIHLLATVAGRPVGSARLLIEGDTGKIGRVCVLAEARGTGLGAALMRAAESTKPS
jgi:ElaA protein